MPYSLGFYQVELSGQTVGSVDLEDMEVNNANDGNKSLQTRVIMQVKTGLGIKSWIDYSNLKLTRLRNSDVPSGCDCECYACDQMSLHCRNRGKGCYI